MYSVGLYSFCGVIHSISEPAKRGVQSSPENPIRTPAEASIRTAAFVIDVPTPKTITVVFAIGIFQ